jgi:hypothetical protein
MSYGGGGYGGGRGGGGGGYSNGYDKFGSRGGNYSSGYSNGYDNLRSRDCCEVGRISLPLCRENDKAVRSTFELAPSFHDTRQQHPLFLSPISFCDLLLTLLMF